MTATERIAKCLADPTIDGVDMTPETLRELTEGVADVPAEYAAAKARIIVPRNLVECWLNVGS